MDRLSLIIKMPTGVAGFGGKIMIGLSIMVIFLSTNNIHIIIFLIAIFYYNLWTFITQPNIHQNMGNKKRQSQKRQCKYYRQKYHYYASSVDSLILVDSISANITVLDIT